MAKVNIDTKQKGTLVSAYVEAPFDKGKKALEAEGFEVIGLRDNAVLRMQEGANSFVSQNGNWTREGVLYVPKKGIFLVKNSPIMENAKEATNCHRNGKEFYLTDEQVERALTDSIKLSDKAISTNRFADNEITAFAFGDVARNYGEFLKENGIKQMPVCLDNLDNKPFARQLWFHNLDGDSVLNGYGRYLDCDVRVRGVSSSGEASAQNFPAAQNSELYTAKQIRTALKKTGITGNLEKQILKNL